MRALRLMTKHVSHQFGFDQASCVSWNSMDFWRNDLFDVKEKYVELFCSLSNVCGSLVGFRHQ